ncbi:MAG: YitT family protein [Desulfobacterales bacterium]|nr:YitT family protein [Desulfobacterales bacterium]MDD4071354.1 YitT family protein [Desulfobacterales bacterium]MDD4392674.1 YitT family protein [Desulfobacterales bacterium]
MDTNTLLNKIKYSIGWNLFIITIGSLIFALGVNGVIIHHDFITGGVFGLALLVYYKTQVLSPGIWFFLMNIPLFAISWFYISKPFLFYSLYAIVVVAIATEYIHLDFGIHQQLYAAIASGIIYGVSGGIILRSLGSSGGLDVIAVILNQKFNFRIGAVYLVFNAILFTFCIAQMGTDLFIASLILVFISSVSLEYVLAMFNQKKMIYIISEQNQAISKTILEELQHSATFIKAKGAYSGKDCDILMTITNNIQLKRMEEVVFKLDPNAMFIVEKTFNVIGSTFGKGKPY